MWSDGVNLTPDLCVNYSKVFAVASYNKHTGCGRIVWHLCCVCSHLSANERPVGGSFSEMMEMTH